MHVLSMFDLEGEKATVTGGGQGFGKIWESDPKTLAPYSCRTHGNLLGNNIPITYPLVNINFNLTKYKFARDEKAGELI